MGGHECIRHYDQATIWRAGLGGNDGFELEWVANGRGNRLHGEGHSGGFEGVQVIFGIGRRYALRSSDP
jgi:hypothetical protein